MYIRIVEREITLTLKPYIMTYSFNHLDSEAAILATAIRSYCTHMGCTGLEAQVDTFLQSKQGKAVKFYADGQIALHKIS